MNKDVINKIREKQRMLALLDQETIILKSDGLKYYRPAGWKHDLFHRKGHYKYRYLRTGNRFGKSELGVVEDIAWCRGERSWYNETDPARYSGIPKRHVRILLIVEDWGKSDDVFTNLENGKFWKYIPKDAFAGYDVGPSGDIDTIKIKSIWGGTSVIKIQTIASFKQSPQRGESSQWDAIHVDEPCPEALWTAVSRGLMDTGGSAWFTCTPLIHPWINRFFIPRGKAVTEKTDPFENEKKFVILGSSYDNKMLTKEHIDDYAKTLKKEERAARITGIPSGAGGFVYDEFDRNIHLYTEDDLKIMGWAGLNDPPRTVWDTDAEGNQYVKKPGYMIRAAIDTHERTPQAVLFEATIGTGDECYIFYFAELFETRIIATTANLFNEVVQGRNLFQTLIDPRAYIESPIDQSTLAGEFLNHGIIGEKAPKDLKRGILKVKEYLTKRDSKGRPVVQFSENLRETLFEFEEYMWDLKDPDKPIDENDHMMENLYRLMSTHPGYVDLDEKTKAHFGQREVFEPQDMDIEVSLEVDGYDD